MPEPFPPVVDYEPVQRRLPWSWSRFIVGFFCPPALLWGCALLSFVTQLAWDWRLLNLMWNGTALGSFVLLSVWLHGRRAKRGFTAGVVTGTIVSSPLLVLLMAAHLERHVNV